MMREVWLSFCPAEMRRELRPDSPHLVVWAGGLTGLLQAAVFGIFTVLRYVSFASARLHQWAPVLSTKGPVVQAGAVIILSLEFLLYPASFLLAYFAIEGFVRFTSALIVHEPLATLPVFLGYKLAELRRRKRLQMHLASLPRDTVEVLNQGERIRIASALPKEHWNASITIAISGAYYEVEQIEAAAPPRTITYQLRKVPIGRVIRRVEEYAAGLASSIDTV